MAPVVDLAAQLWGGVPALFAGPLDDVSSLIFYRELQSYLNAEFQSFGVRLFGRMMEWAGAVSLSLLTLWIILHGYRITTGQSRDSMAIFITDMAKAVAILSVATGTAIAGGTLYDWICNQLPNQINRLVADHDGDLYATIDRTFGYMQLGLSSIGDLLTADNALLEAAKTRNQGFVIAGTGMPALVAGALLLFYQAMLALIVGFAPLGVLSLLFKRTESFFWNWLLTLLSTLVAMAVLSVMAAYLLDVVCAVAISFWAGKLMGSNPEGINSLALQQGGLGLIFTTLMITVPPAIARIFKGLLGDFMPFSAFSAGWSAPFARNTQPQGHAHPPAHLRANEQAGASTPTHAHRGIAPAQGQADEVKQATDTRSFTERYPNATASLDGHGGGGDQLPEDIRSQAGIDSTRAHRSQPWSMGLGDGLDEMTALSPTLQADILKLKQMDWEFRYGTVGAGSQARRGFRDLTISIDGKWKENTREGFRAVVHEIGHGIYPYREDHSSKGAYIAATLADEAAAMMKNIQIQREILVNTQGRIDIGINGTATNHAAYNAAYDQFLLDGDADKARRSIGEVFGDKETTSSKVTGKIVPYRDYYGEFYDLKHRR